MILQSVHWEQSVLGSKVFWGAKCVSALKLLGNERERRRKAEGNILDFLNSKIFKIQMALIQNR